MSDADRCSELLSQAAATAVAHGGVTVEIRLLTHDGWWQWAHYGTPTDAMQALARIPVTGGTQ